MSDDVILSEKCLIGCILLEPEIFEGVRACLTVQWLSDKRNKRIWELVDKCYKVGKTCDPIWIADNGVDFDYLTSCMDLVTTSQNFALYLDVIRKKKLQEAILLQSQRDPEDVEALETILEKYNDTSYGTKAHDTGELFDKALQIAGQPGREPEIHLEWKRLNDYLFGLKRGAVYVVAGRPGHNKTNFLFNMVICIALQKKVWLLCDYEMSLEDIIFRIAAIYTGISLSHFTKGRDDYGNPLKDAQIYDVKIALQHAKEQFAPYIHIRKHLRLSDIKKAAKEVKADVISIDHLQIFSQVMPISKNESVSHHISSLCQKIKLMAEQLDVAVIEPSQVNRGAEGRMPTLADLKESGGIEENADVVITIFTPSVVEPSKHELKGLFQIFTPKNRHGPQGTMDMKINHKTGKITEDEQS